MSVKTSLIPISELFSKSWNIYKKIWAILLVISAITVFAWKVWQFFVVPYLIVMSGFTGIASGVLSGNPANAVAIAMIGFAIILLSLLVVLEIGFLGSAGIIVAINHHLKGTHPKLGSIYKEAKTYLLPLSVVGILVFMVELLGLIMLVIPGLIFMFFLTFCNYIVINEKIRGLAVLGRSIHLVESHFGEILLRFLAMGVISFFVNMLFSKIFLYQFVSQTVIMPFSIIYHFLLYKDVIAKS